MCVCACVSEAFAGWRYLTRRLINIEMTSGREVQRLTSGERQEAGMGDGGEENGGSDSARGEEGGR